VSPWGDPSFSFSETPYAVLQGRLKLREFGDGTAELIYYERPDKSRTENIEIHEDANIGRRVDA
jgi:hypothetical protein